MKERPSKNRVTMSGGDLDETAIPSEEEEQAPVMENNISARNSFESQQKPRTKVEKLMDKIENRQNERMEVSYRSRMKFINLCLKKVHGTSEGIPIEEVKQIKDEQNKDESVHRIFEEAVKRTEEVNADVFYFRDFNEYHLTLKMGFFRRNPLIAALIGFVAFYIFSIILFCAILGNNSTCPRKDGDPSYAGYLTAIYFASVTLSTVGYGDVSVIGSGEEVWRVAIGTLYMILAMIVAVTVFSSLSGKALEFSANAIAPKLAPFLSRFTAVKKSQGLSYQLRMVWTFKLFELIVSFLLINIIGMVIAMIIMASTEEGKEKDWSWMTALYWAVQTTTTIGYGDLNMPFALRWFNFLFAIIGTTFAASLLGSLADLRNEVNNLRTLYVWENREVSTQLIADMDADDTDADGESNEEKKVDQYEFLIASLLTLGKIDREDVTKIMNKFQKLAGEDQVIGKVDIEAHNKRINDDGNLDTDSYWKIQAEHT